jgi:ABC-type amino acid transport substrate-binding protein
MKPLRWITAALLLVILAAAATQLLPTRSRFRNRLYRIGWEPRLPYQEMDKDGNPTGLAVELVREAARRRGVRLEWVRQYRGPDIALREKAVDLWPIITILPERQGVVHITEPFLEATTTFLVAAQSSFVQAGDMAAARVAFLDSPVLRSVLTAPFPRSRWCRGRHCRM